ncbi:hypothetical protein KAW18_11935 [candidate division WOR-3 bacterium]|nr:hypothetical protein [candidate division WOR-3 bacterium]
MGLKFGGEAKTGNGIDKRSELGYDIIYVINMNNKVYLYALIILLSFLLIGLSCRKHNDGDLKPVYDGRNISRNEGLSSAPRCQLIFQVMFMLYRRIILAYN